MEITLNYNGKFKEKYSFIYEDQAKINNLVKNNIFTKNIAGKDLIFLKGGRYLIEEEIDDIGFEPVYRGKDLEKDKIVAIKSTKIKNKVSPFDARKRKEQLKEIKDSLENKAIIVKEISKKNNFPVKYEVF